LHLELECRFSSLQRLPVSVPVILKPLDLPEKILRLVHLQVRIQILVDHALKGLYVGVKGWPLNRYSTEHSSTVREYNYERPHRSLGLKTPMEMLHLLQSHSP